MKIKCRICHNKGIGILNAITYSSDGKMRCGSCGISSGLTKLESFIYKVLEGGFVLFSIIYSFYLLSPWPVMVLIPLIVLIRAFLLPMISSRIQNNYSWRIKKN